MVIRIGEHAKIDSYIKSNDVDTLAALKAEAIDELEEVKIWKSAGITPNIDRKQIELLIEIVVKIEAYEQRKGWLFRSKRRTQMLIEYT